MSPRSSGPAPPSVGAPLRLHPPLLSTLLAPSSQQPGSRAPGKI
ncbi:hypothetical protein VULLAG_LOCUS14419 [Vulpes lagopus]